MVLPAYAESGVNDKRRKAASDPLRVRILHLLSYPPRELTVRDLASELGVAANGLYYHLKMLEEAEMIQVAEVRPIGRTAERVYRHVEYRVKWDWAQPDDLALLFGSLSEIARQDVTAAVYAHSHERASRKVPRSLSPSVQAPTWTLPVADRDAFLERMRALQDEYRAISRERLAAAGGKVPGHWRELHITTALWDTAANVPSS